VGGVGSRGEPTFEGLAEAFDLALGMGVAGAAVLLFDAEGVDQVLEVALAAVVARESGGVDPAIVGQRRCG
jgi:hypothetical protein